MLGKTILVAALGAALCVTAMDAQAKDVKVGVVVKIGGIPWFNAMETGIKEQVARNSATTASWLARPAPIRRCRCAPSKT